MAVGPQIRLAFENENELVFVGFGMRPGKAPARRQSVVMSAETRQTEGLAE